MVSVDKAKQVKSVAEPMFTMPTLMEWQKNSHFIPDYRFAFICATEKYDSTYRVKNDKAEQVMADLQLVYDLSQFKRITQPLGIEEKYLLQDPDYK